MHSRRGPAMVLTVALGLVLPLLAACETWPTPTVVPTKPPALATAPPAAKPTAPPAVPTAVPKPTLAATVAPTAAPKPTPLDAAKLTENIVWRGHDTFIIKGPVVIYTDPYRLKKGEPKADIILITHDHTDHCSPADVAQIQKTDTVIVTTTASAAKLKGDIKVVKPSDKITVKGVEIEAVPAYNTNKFSSPGVPFHPKASGMVGFVFKANSIWYYHAGDTDNIPELANLAPDVAFIPVSGQFVMTVDEAVEAAKAIKPKVAIPMHYGGTIGTPQDGANFKAKATVPVVVPILEE